MPASPLKLVIVDSINTNSLHLTPSALPSSQSSNLDPPHVSLDDADDAAGTTGTATTAAAAAAAAAATALALALASSTSSHTSVLQGYTGPNPLPRPAKRASALSAPASFVKFARVGIDSISTASVPVSELPSRSESPAPSLSGPILKRRSSRRLPSFLARFSSSFTSPVAGGAVAAPPSPLRTSSGPPLHTNLHPPKGISDTAGQPRDNPNDQESRSENVLSRTPCPHPVPQSHDRSSTPAPSIAPSVSTRRTSDANKYPQHFKFPQQIFTSTAACRLSVPIEAFRRLDSVVEQEITSKMHQTSSRLLRMTEDERPYTRDFEDLFSTLMVSLPLTPHRVRFQKIEHTFTSDEAMTNLGSLKFSQSNRMPDPKDPSRIVTTTTTTTFSMAKEMAKSVCSKFLEARFVESVDGKNDFSSKSAVWQLTPKGMHILHRFCNRNGINQRHVQAVLESPRNTMHLVLLERESEGDKIHRDQATIEVVFRRFVGGQDGPNLKWSTSSSDSDSLTDYQTGLVGVKMARERKIGDKTYWNTFTGKAAVDWLMDCCTMVDKRETIVLAGLFCDCGLIQAVESTVQPCKFSPAKSSIYYVTERGQYVAGWIPSPKGTARGNEPLVVPRRTEGSRDSNANKMTVIIRDPALRLLFREFLRDTHCEENLAFYLDVKEFLATYGAAKKNSPVLRLDTIRETLAAAYSLYNAFLAPGSPCELNIDHSLRTALAGRMTRAVGDDEATITSLDEVAQLFDQAQNSVFKLMASDSVPKFMREPKYSTVFKERNLDVGLTTPSRSSG